MDTSSLYNAADSRAQPHVLVIDHVVLTASAMASALLGAGMRVESATTGLDAVERKAICNPEIVLLDLQLPDVRGFDLVERFARDGDCGLILVSADADEAARVEGLDRGGDDFIVKPVPLRELAARIRALYRRLKRIDQRRSALPPSPATAATRIVLDPAHRCVIGVRGELTPLSEAEFTALETLVDADGAPVSRDWLGRVALKRPLHADDRSVDQLMLKLRRKLSASGAADRTILSARRQGYVIPDPSLFRVSASQAPATRVIPEKRVEAQDLAGA
jgi:DNA-binding response OmpR family regulator